MFVQVGAKGDASVTVNTTNTALAMGSGNVPAFATPALVALMERAAVEAIHRQLEGGEATVGSMISVRHLAPTPIGKRVRAEAVVTAVDGRKITFTVNAWDAVEKVGEGTHERVLIDRDRFVFGLAKKGMPDL
jgi:fluoroacetyl-CoA thioesterase